jgi:hypothetical protein
MKQCPHCQGDLSPAALKARSNPQHARFFAMVRFAFENWPEHLEFQPANEGELRAYLTMKAGWRDIAARVPISGMKQSAAEMLVTTAIRACKSFALPIIHKGEIIIFEPRSISFARMPHKEFCDLSDQVGIEIEKQTGLRFEDDGRDTKAA